MFLETRFVKNINDSSKTCFSCRNLWVLQVDLLLLQCICKLASEGF